MEDIKYDKLNFTQTSRVDRVTLLIDLYNKNSHVTTASAIAAKSDLLSLHTKNSITSFKI